MPHAPFAELIRMFGFRALTAGAIQKASSDKRIHLTIIKAIDLYFQEKPDLILVYVCDTMDGRQRQRSLLFERWFTEFGDGYQRHAYTDNAYTYCGLICRKGHPYADELDEAVTDYIRAKAAE